MTNKEIKIRRSRFFRAVKKSESWNIYKKIFVCEFVPEDVPYFCGEHWSDKDYKRYTAGIFYTCPIYDICVGRIAVSREAYLQWLQFRGLKEDILPNRKKYLKSLMGQEIQKIKDKLAAEAAIIDTLPTNKAA